VRFANRLLSASCESPSTASQREGQPQQQQQRHRLSKFIERDRLGMQTHLVRLSAQSVSVLAQVRAIVAANRGSVPPISPAVEAAAAAAAPTDDVSPLMRTLDAIERESRAGAAVSSPSLAAARRPIEQSLVATFFEFARMTRDTAKRVGGVVDDPRLRRHDAAGARMAIALHAQLVAVDAAFRLVSTHIPHALVAALP